MVYNIKNLKYCVPQFSKCHYCMNIFHIHFWMIFKKDKANKIITLKVNYGIYCLVYLVDFLILS